MDRAIHSKFHINLTYIFFKTKEWSNKMTWRQVSPMAMAAHGTPLASSHTIPLGRSRHFLVTNQESQQIFARTSSMNMPKMASDTGTQKNQEFHVSGSSFYNYKSLLFSLHNHLCCNDVNQSAGTPEKNLFRKY